MTKNSLNNKITKLANALDYKQVLPNIVQPATAYFDMLGDDLRRRLFIVQDSMHNNGNQDFVLRPEFTICIAKDYLQNNTNNQPAKLCYSGPVFRSDPVTHVCNEFVQTGIEIFAAKDSFKADIETIEYALKALDILNIKQVELKMGDYDLFFSLIQNLNISDIWRKKLRRLFLSHNNLESLLKKLNRPQTVPVNHERAAFLNAIEGLEVSSAQMLVENVLSFSGIDLIGGRSAGEIAERFLEQAALSATPTLPDDILVILKEYFSISGQAINSIEKLNAFNKKHSLKLEDKIIELQNRFNAIEALNIGNFTKDNIQFNTLLGRGFEYYTGMVFEIVDAKKRVSSPLIAGGRYDALAKQLGATQNVNAVGASLWDARIAEILQLDAEDK
ncbi:MAG: ATP phosphoribosyltransferase regulatory subunit [Rhizobiales bacterium]|nr:ATP phosphoribosyltransferase regulatory subunit [Hyphomicrobiales bacterium]